MVGSTAARPLGWAMHFGSKKKFCMSTITSADVSGEIATEVPSGPWVVGMVILLSEAPEISNVLVAWE